MDDPTATARIRAAFPQIQVIALTSFADETLVPCALQAGAISYLLRDVHPDQLATRSERTQRDARRWLPLRWKPSRIWLPRRQRRVPS